VHLRASEDTMKLNNNITDVRGIKVGHAHNIRAITGCTVILCAGGAVGGVDQRGGAPGTRETDALHPMHLVNVVHAIVLAGGSAFGLDAASGVVKFLEEKRIGFDVGVARVPIVPSAILFDLGLGQSNVRPDAKLGYRACLNAKRGKISEGNVGAGTGATVGKILGIKHAMKSGIGSASISIRNGVIVGAIVAVNAFGDVIDPDTNQIIAGARSSLSGRSRKPISPYFVDTMSILKRSRGFGPRSRSNTVIGVVATNAKFNKEQINKVAQMAQDGIARTIRPAHTMVDGDTLFALATGEKKADVNVVGAFAAEVVALAILNGVRAARSIAGLPAWIDRPAF
jgi:L-aminopeptidase/D-esterase-like protein